MEGKEGPGSADRGTQDGGQLSGQASRLGGGAGVAREEAVRLHCLVWTSWCLTSLDR